MSHIRARSSSNYTRRPSLHLPKRVRFDATYNQSYCLPPSLSYSTSPSTSDSLLPPTPPRSVFFEPQVAQYRSRIPQSTAKHRYQYYTPSPSDPSPSACSVQQTSYFDPRPKSRSQFGLHSLLYSGPSLLPSFDLSSKSLIFPSHLPLDDPSTSPPIPSMFIVCDHLPWSITVMSSSASRGVTVKDVIKGVCTSLRTPVTQAEFDGLRRDEREAVKRAFNERCRRTGGSAITEGNTPAYHHRRTQSILSRRSSLSTNQLRDTSTRAGAAEDERQKGVKRIDWLKGKTKFAGLEQIRAQEGTVWVLKVSWRIED